MLEMSNDIIKALTIQEMVGLIFPKLTRQAERHKHMDALGHRDFETWWCANQDQEPPISGCRNDQFSGRCQNFNPAQRIKSAKLV